MGKEARNKARELRAAQVAAERRRRRQLRLFGWIGGLVIAGLLAGITVVVINAVSEDDDGRANGELVVPANADDSGAILVGQADAPVTVAIYQDYICPGCGAFEKANGHELERLVNAGKIKMELHPLAFLDEYSQGTRYSSRTANALATVADRAPESVLAFNRGLYAEQPPENSRGLSDDKIAEIATKAGVPQEVVDTFKDDIFAQWVADGTEAAFDSGIEGTPIIKINGKRYSGDLLNTDSLVQTIAAAGGTD